MSFEEWLIHPMGGVLLAAVAKELETARDTQTAACALSLVVPALLAAFGLPPSSPTAAR
jgi:hypothetical protein